MEISSLTTDIDDCIDAVISLQCRSFLWLAGYEFDLSDDHSMFRIWKFAAEFNGYFDQKIVDEEKELASKINL